MAAPNFKGVNQAANPHFRDEILFAIKKGPNFAGTYLLVEATCGTGCADIGVVDVRTGRVFGHFPFGYVYFGNPHDDPYGKVSYSLNSRLLVIEGRIDGVSRQPARAYYEWRDPDFHLLYLAPLARPEGEARK